MSTDHCQGIGGTIRTRKAMPLQPTPITGVSMFSCVHVRLRDDVLRQASGFVPPQVTVLSARPAAESVMVRFLASEISQSRLSGEAVLYWRDDMF